MVIIKGRLWLPNGPRAIILAFLLLVPASFYLYQSYEATQQREAARASSHSKINFNESAIGQHPTVNLVVATLLKDDISWTRNIAIPNLNVIRYVSDYPDAEFHPPVPNKGREALIYHTYMHDFYDDLPDISIMTHADETSWHVENILNSSMTLALSLLDLDAVMKREYFNLRVSWKGGCPAWINTTFTDGPDDEHKLEEQYMQEAFSENFPTNNVPEILGGPCCSQFAVTRDAVQKHPKSQYRHNMDWLVQTDWNDFIAGRVWEHLWQYAFKGQAVDCANEWESYCFMYHICFDDKSREFVTGLEEEREELKENTSILKELLDPQGGLEARRRLEEIDFLLQVQLEDALERGRNDTERANLLSKPYA
ncbi:hypothetical protein F5Y15DRAFT_364153 [Xylariaceae sp. FL0016]|nr:hypothetical protein F5Y15DRAFT_364153 [Xylariaceae sp. FL0016]